MPSWFGFWVTWTHTGHHAVCFLVFVDFVWPFSKTSIFWKVTWSANIDSIPWITFLYHMATIVRALWLATKRALFSYNDRALLQLARCSRHIQSVFNLIVDIVMDIHVMVNWQLSKRIFADECHMTVSRSYLRTVAAARKMSPHWSQKTIAQHCLSLFPFYGLEIES